MDIHIPNTARIVKIGEDEVAYRFFRIKPKNDFPADRPQTGFIVTDGVANIMPSHTYFKSVDEAKHAIDVLIAVRGDRQMLWEIMDPFKVTPGDRMECRTGLLSNGVFVATIVDYVVTEVSIRHHGDNA